MKNVPVSHLIDLALSHQPLSLSVPLATVSLRGCRQQLLFALLVVHDLLLLQLLPHALPPVSQLVHAAQQVISLQFTLLTKIGKNTVLTSILFNIKYNIEYNNIEYNTIQVQHQH